MNPLDHACPQCKAPAGQKCKNYAGKGMVPHRARGMDANKLRNQAAKKNAAEAEAMPLFAAQLEPHTLETEKARAQRNAARAAENRQGLIVQGDVRGIDLAYALHVRHIERVAAELLGDDFARLHQHIRTLGGGIEHVADRWRDLLTGKRKEMAWERDPDWRPGCGRPAMRCTDFYERQHMTAEEFSRRFPWSYELPRQEQDALAEQIDQQLARLRSNRE